MTEIDEQSRYSIHTNSAVSNTNHDEQTLQNSKNNNESSSQESIKQIRRGRL